MMPIAIVTRNDFLFDVYCIIASLARNYTGQAKDDFGDAYASLVKCQEFSTEMRDLIKSTLDHARHRFGNDEGGTIDPIIVLTILYGAIARDDIYVLRRMFLARRRVNLDEASDEPPLTMGSMLRDAWNAIKARIRGLWQSN